MQIEVEFLSDEKIYERVMKEEVPSARVSVLIATALVKQTTVELEGEFVPFIKVIDELISRGVNVSLLFAGKPSRPFTECLGQFQRVLANANIRLCVRNHMKIVLIDSSRLYLGSANLTGAGLGRKSRNRRNFEFGLFTTDTRVISWITNIVRDIWEGNHCSDCGTKRLCKLEHERFGASIPEQPTAVR